MPRSSLKPGMTHRAKLRVTDELTVPQVSSRLPGFGDMPPVFATALMIAHIEETCINALAAHLEEGEHTVGTYVDVSHVAATPTGLTVTSTVELREVERRKLVFKV